MQNMENKVVASKIGDIRKELSARMVPVRITDDGVVCDLIMSEGYYIGETQNGKRHGKGTMYYTDGSTCEGDWADDKGNGEMTYKSQDGTVIYQGQVQNGRYNGKGLFVDMRHKRIYKGEFVDSLYEGRGRLYNLKKELLYEGDWKSGKQCGQGKSYFLGELYYEGEWKDGEANGMGTNYNNVGCPQYTGLWKDGKPVDTDSRINRASKEYLDNN